MFYGQTKNSNNQLNVNTRLYSSFSDQCMITLGAWNLNLSLKFHPLKGTNDQGLRQYAQDNNEIITTSLTIDNATALLKGIEDVVKPAIEKKEAGKISVPISSGDSAKVLTIGTDGNDVTMSIAVGVSQEGTTTEDKIITHKFNKRAYYKGFDVLTGKGEEVVVESDFDNFVEKLKSIYTLAPATAHAIKYNTALSSSFQNKSYSNNQNNSVSTYSAPVSNSSLEDVFPM